MKKIIFYLLVILTSCGVADDAILINKFLSEITKNSPCKVSFSNKLSTKEGYLLTLTYNCSQDTYEKQPNLIGFIAEQLIDSLIKNGIKHDQYDLMNANNELLFEFTSYGYEQIKKGESTFKKYLSNYQTSGIDDIYAHLDPSIKNELDFDNADTILNSQQKKSLLYSGFAVFTVKETQKQYFSFYARNNEGNNMFLTLSNDVNDKTIYGINIQQDDEE